MGITSKMITEFIVRSMKVKNKFVNFRRRAAVEKTMSKVGNISGVLAAGLERCRKLAAKIKKQNK